MITGFLYPASLQGQSFLYLHKEKGTFRLKIFEGEELHFRLHEDETFTRGIIDQFTDSSFVIHETEVPIDQIAEIDISEKNHSIWSFRSSPGKLMLAGALFPLIDWFNEGDQIPNSLLIASASIFLSGVIMKQLERTRFYPGGKYKLIIIKVQETRQNPISSPPY